MILYFSATGNTQYAAQRIARASGDSIVSIREYLQNGTHSFSLKENENFGIATPTYFQGMPLFLLRTILYFPDVPKRFRITHPTMIRIIAMTPTVFTFCPNTAADMIVVATIPPAHQVA